MSLEREVRFQILYPPLGRQGCAALLNSRYIYFVLFEFLPGTPVIDSGCSFDEHFLFT
jgi:hypothetical protein